MSDSYGVRDEACPLSTRGGSDAAAASPRLFAGRVPVRAGGLRGPRGFGQRPRAAARRGQVRPFAKSRLLKVNPRATAPPCCFCRNSLARLFDRVSDRVSDHVSDHVSDRVSPRAARCWSRSARSSRPSASPRLPSRSPPPLRTDWTRRVLHPVLIGHAVSLTPY